MIIHSSKALKTYRPVIADNKVIENVKEIKSNEVAQKSKKKKHTPAPIIEEPVVVVEEKVEDEDLSKWLEEHTED